MYMARSGKYAPQEGYKRLSKFYSKVKMVVYRRDKETMKRLWRIFFIIRENRFPQIVKTLLFEWFDDCFNVDLIVDDFERIMNSKDKAWF